jgi:GTPase SAR1 family protein
MSLSPNEENPFCVSGRTIHDPGPLCPWLEKEHGECYVPVDRTQEAHDEFVLRLPQFKVARNGLTVLVHGENGCGKTSLIHRCAALLEQWQLEKQGERSAILDRSAENLSGLVILRRCEDTVSALLEFVRQKNAYLAPDAIENLPTIPAEADQITLRKTVEELSRNLVANKLNLIAIAPKIELAEELRMYLSLFQRGGLSLLLETEDQEVLQSAERWNRDGKRSVVILKVGPLAPEDGWKFVAARYQRRNAGKASPTFDEGGVKEYMQKRSSGTTISVRELERVCIALYEEARNAASLEIRYQQFADHYVKVGSLAALYET